MIKPSACLRLCLLVSCGLLLNQSKNVEASSSSSVPENQLKAAYLIHLSEFTTWPDQKMQLPYFSICLASGSKLSEPLEQIKGRLVKERPLEIRYDVPVEKLNSCHIFYVEDEFNKKVFQQSLLKSEPILTVSSDADFAKEGGVIEYYSDFDKVRMRVNLKVMTQLHLNISSKLLRLMDSSF